MFLELSSGTRHGVLQPVSLLSKLASLVHRENLSNDSRADEGAGGPTASIMNVHEIHPLPPTPNPLIQAPPSMVPSLNHHLPTGAPSFTMDSSTQMGSSSLKGRISQLSHSSDLFPWIVFLGIRKFGFGTGTVVELIKLPPRVLTAPLPDQLPETQEK